MTNNFEIGDLVKLINKFYVVYSEILQKCDIEKSIFEVTSIYDTIITIELCLSRTKVSVNVYPDDIEKIQTTKPLSLFELFYDGYF